MGEGVVAQSGGSNSRGPWFESSHWGKYIMNTFTVSVENTKMSNERPGMELNEHNIFLFFEHNSLPFEPRSCCSLPSYS